MTDAELGRLVRELLRETGCAVFLAARGEMCAVGVWEGYDESQTVLLDEFRLTESASAQVCEECGSRADACRGTQTRTGDLLHPMQARNTE